MTKQEKLRRMQDTVQALEERYPEAICSLEYGGDPFKLLIMGRLSAQCTDERVNLVCRDLFAKYPTPEALAEGELSEIEDCIRSCGLYHTKAKNIKDAAALYLTEFGGVLPSTMEELLRFPGVGRKVANLLLGDIFHQGAVVTDTHCIRICGRLGYYPEKEKNPYKIERLLTPLLAPERSSDFCHRLVLFGREICTARSPKCDACPLGARGLCTHYEREQKRNADKDHA